MNDISDNLRRVFSTDLIAPSMVGLSATLGVPRVSLYRLMNGTASDKVVANVIGALGERLNISADDLTGMVMLADNASRLTRALRGERAASGREGGWNVVRAFVSREFGEFSERFREEELPGLLKFAEESPAEFHAMLFYYYVKSLGTSFYKRGLDYRGRCERILGPLGDRLIEMYPENTAGTKMAYSFVNAAFYDFEAPILWSFVTSIGGPTLNVFACPTMMHGTFGETILLPGTSGRTYWRCPGHEGPVLTRTVESHIQGRGIYDLFELDPATGEPENSLQLLIYEEGICQIFRYADLSMLIAAYDWADGTLELSWPDNAVNPTGLGDRWTVIDPATSRSIRETDRALTDAALDHAANVAQGMTEMEGMDVVDVRISRRRLILVTSGGAEYAIDRDSRPFLGSLRPDEPVNILLEVSSDTPFVVWPKLVHALPLSEFDKHD